MVLISMLEEQTLTLILYSFTEQPCLADLLGLAAEMEVVRRESGMKGCVVVDGVLIEEIVEVKEFDVKGLEQLE